MPEWSGLEVLRKIKELNPDIDIVMMTAYGTIEYAVEIMKEGAYDYLSKPVDLDELENMVKRVEEKRMLTTENRLLKEQLRQKFNFDGIFSQSSAMEEVMNLAARVASSKTTVLVRGESGTGKELIARAIHYASPRKNRPCVVVNVAALSENLLESELFGHEKGSFTGATQQKIGRFEEADGGALFIDEIGDMPLAVQVKLLRAIQFGQIQRVGGNKTINVDVRIIAATNRDIEAMIKRGGIPGRPLLRTQCGNHPAPASASPKNGYPPIDRKIHSEIFRRKSQRGARHYPRGIGSIDEI